MGIWLVTCGHGFLQEGRQRAALGVPAGHAARLRGRCQRGRSGRQQAPCRRGPPRRLGHRGRAQRAQIARTPLLCPVAAALRPCRGLRHP